MLCFKLLLSEVGCGAAGEVVLKLGAHLLGVGVELRIGGHDLVNGGVPVLRDGRCFVQCN